MLSPGGPGSVRIVETQSPADTPRIEFWRPGEEEELAAFDKRRGGVPSTAEYWRWKYSANPAGPACVAVARAGRDIVGQVAYLPVRMRVGGREVVASQQVDVAIMPERRGGGLYFQLANAVMEEGPRRGVAFGFGFATEDTRALSVDFLGFDLVGPVRRLVKVLDYGHYAGRLLGRRGAGLIRSLGNGRRRRRPAPLPEGVDRVDRFDEAVDGLAARLVPEATMAIRDAAYLNWRYADCPTVDYRRYALRSDDGTVAGFVIVHSHEAAGMVWGIVDEIVCPPDDPGLVKCLLAPALADLAAEGCFKAVCWLPRWHPLGNGLRSLGFRDRKTRNHLIVLRDRTSGAEAERLGEEDRWYFTHGDSDFKMRSA